MEIFSTFHARVEYISVKTVIRQIDLPTPHSDDATVTDGNQSITVYSPVHSVHLADIIKQ